MPAEETDAQRNPHRRLHPSPASEERRPHPVPAASGAQEEEPSPRTREGSAWTPVPGDACSDRREQIEPRTNKSRGLKAIEKD